MKIAARSGRPGGDRADRGGVQLRSLRGAGVAVESVLEVSVVVDVAAGVVLFSVAFGSAGVIAGAAAFAGVVCVVVLAVVDDESVDCATAAPMPASSAAAAARADNFF